MSNHLVTVATFGDSVRADIAKNYLELLGIPAFVADVEFITWYWTYANAIGWIKLQVGDQVAAEARTLLNWPRDPEASPLLSREDVGLESSPAEPVPGSAEP